MTKRKPIERIPSNLIHQVRFVTRGLSLTRKVPWMSRLVTDLTAQDLIQLQVRPCGICGRKSGIGTVFASNSLVCPCQYL